MSLTFIRKEPAYYAVFDGREQVGWLSRNAIGFCGFTSVAEARDAGGAAARALARWLEARSTIGGESLAFLWNREWSPEREVDDCGVPPPVYATRQCSHSRSFAFELPLPEETRSATAMHAVQELYCEISSPAASHVSARVGAGVGSDAA